MIRKTNCYGHVAFPIAHQRNIEVRLFEHALFPEADRMWILTHAFDLTVDQTRMPLFARHENANGTGVLCVGETKFARLHGLVNPDLHHVSFLFLPGQVKFDWFVREKLDSKLFLIRYFS